MTYSSCWIEALPADHIEPENPTAATRAPTLVKLEGANGGRVSVWALSDWALSHGAPRRYVDNCWLRVEVPGALLRQFMADFGVAGETGISEIDDARQYVVVAEEY